ncbi:fasciclin-like arabinogalactan protein 11 [Musa acuminata AAA Group]|uniref:fasciclin-like arabinogalactan protein 11 n=1 Tax=Musa acuminata AAA Group TaxID=214697 RepID=UPI0031DB7CDD
MATTSVFMVFGLAAVLVLTAPLVQAQPEAAPPAPAGQLNITAILAKGGRYTSFIRLLRQTQVDEQINSQLSNSYNGLTLFAPTDNAFAGLKVGTLNGLSQQQQIELVLYHVLPRYYSLTAFQTATNPVMTQASGKTGVWTLNVTTSSDHQANVSTGVVEVPIDNAVYADFPLAVYSVEKVLLPYEIFGPKPPAAAPTPSTKKPSPAPEHTADVGAAPPPEGSSDSGASLKAREAGWSFIAGVGLLGIAAGNLL